MDIDVLPQSMVLMKPPPLTHLRPPHPNHFSPHLLYVLSPFWSFWLIIVEGLFDSLWQKVPSGTQYFS